MWDYVGDGYVHRLVQEMADGKLVEVPEERHGRGAPVGTAGGRYGGDDGGYNECGKEEKDKDKEEVILNSKLETITAEYNHLLVT